MVDSEGSGCSSGPIQAFDGFGRGVVVEAESISEKVELLISFVTGTGNDLWLVLTRQFRNSSVPSLMTMSAELACL